ncbi:hypothetical protein AYO20_08555 [Fonsecaea nubica]|uniref:D-lactate dehydrogenase (cytochrome) n=1 Tax=Fonsecaea nubica TaxID=856822 RepID=A0A178CP07_9EURO|nr:hypothetical protein AYO20_08555 [Fonsecaea nubica]OAL30862.1 hypothetical protein AYO20_08555 [Fonsecaea nubica]
MLVDTIINTVTSSVHPVVAVLALPLALVLLEVAWIIYARNFHPLADVPGPWLASVSRLWVMRRLKVGDMDQVQRNLHRRYGPLVRIAPNEIACSDPEAIKVLYRTAAPLTKTDFYPVWGNPRMSKYADNFSQVNERLHSERRRIVNHVYSLSNVLQSEASIDRVTTVMVEKLTQLAQRGQDCDLGTWIQWYTFDVIGELFFGRMFGFLQQAADYQAWIASLDALMPGFCQVAVAPTYLRPFILLSSLFDSKMNAAIKCTQTMEVAAREGVARRQAELDQGSSTSDSRDLLQQLFNIQREKGEKMDFSMREVEQEAYIALLAGSDTTAIAIRSIFYHIVKDPKVYQRLRAEIDQANAEGELSFPVKHAQALKLPYLCACIKEGMRMHPSVGLTLPRLMPAGGLQICGKYVPEGYRVGVNAAVIHFDKRIFGDDAHQFRPERWLDPAAAANMDRYMFQFGYGTRTCIGKNSSPDAVVQTFKSSKSMGATAAVAILAGIATVSLLASYGGEVHAEAPHGPQTLATGTASTLPLSSVQPLQYDLSEKNLHEAYQEFMALLGEENVSLNAGERCTRSSTEWSPAPRADDIPSMIVYPRHTQDVSQIARICHGRRIPMIGFCGGTSLEGTLAAQHQEVCIDFNRHMNRVLEIRKGDMDVTVQPSVAYQELNALLAQQDMFFPPDPGPGAQIGGMIAQGCSGTNAYRYGTMKDWVLGLEVVLADGTIIQTRHRPRKSSSGYDLTRLFTGSEGTLGFVTKAHLKLTKKPENVRVAVAQFASIDDAVKMAVHTVQSGNQLEAMELLDDLSMHAVNEGGYCSVRWAEKPTLFLKISGSTPQLVAQMARQVEETARESGASLFKLAATDEEGQELWEARKTALWSTLALKKSPDDKFISADACVPISRLGDIIRESRERLTESKMLGSFLGHVGDGNFHATVLYNAQEKAQARQLISDIQRLSVDMDGTVSGEHGIGLEYRDQVVYELGEASVDTMRAIKFALDPLCLLNPGKMIRVEKVRAELEDDKGGDQNQDKK